MRKFVSWLWWSLPWLQMLVDRVLRQTRYAGKVISRAVRPTVAFFMDLRTDALLLLVAAIFVWLQGGGSDDLILGAEVIVAVVGAVLFVNLLLAPSRVYWEMRDELGERIYELERELQRYRYPEDQEAKRIARQREAVARQFGTELRDIRHKIDIVKAGRPHPTYSSDFSLPGARWDQFDEFLAEKWPEMYGPLEKAYTAAHHVNEHVDARRGRSPGATLGVIRVTGWTKRMTRQARRWTPLANPEERHGKPGQVRPSERSRRTSSVNTRSKAGNDRGLLTRILRRLLDASLPNELSDLRAQVEDHRRARPLAAVEIHGRKRGVSREV